MLLRRVVRVRRVPIAARAGRLFSTTGLFRDMENKPWDTARTYLAQENAMEAYKCSAAATGQALDYAQEHEDEETTWVLPLLTLEVAKSLLKLAEHRDAIVCFKQAKRMFEGELLLLAVNWCSPPTASCRGGPCHSPNNVQNTRLLHIVTGSAQSCSRWRGRVLWRARFQMWISR